MKRTTKRLKKEPLSAIRAIQLANAHRQLEQAGYAIDEDEETGRKDRVGSRIMRVAVAIFLIMWIAIMTWFAVGALKKKEPAATLERPAPQRALSL